MDMRKREIHAVALNGPGHPADKDHGAVRILALDDPVTIDALDGLPMVLPTASSGRRSGFDGMFAEAGVAPRVTLECDERSSWVPAVLAGVGSCVWYGAQADAARRFGAEVRAFTPPMRRQIALVQRRGQLNDDASTVATAVIDLWPT